MEKRKTNKEIEKQLGRWRQKIGVIERNRETEIDRKTKR
jgi:hypothetical protein